MRQADFCKMNENLELPYAISDTAFSLASFSLCTCSLSNNSRMYYPDHEAHKQCELTN
jgi:hypothetical protein